MNENQVAPRRPTYWKQLLIFSIFPILFGVLQWAYQFYVLIPGESAGSLVRSTAITGATLIGLALLSSVIFRLFPRYARHWRYRRYLGVWGFIFSFLHTNFVTNLYFGGDIASIYYTFNPIENPIIFGSIGLFIFFLLALTSTDWAVRKLTPRIWKNLHRLVYIAYISSVFHFAVIDPSLFENVAGIILLIVTVLTVVGHLYLFFKTIIKKRFMSLGTVVGFAIIISTILVAMPVYEKYFAKPEITEGANELDDLETSIQEMMEFMESNPVDADVATSPIPEDQAFSGILMKQGTFEDINYMTDGSVTFERRGDRLFVVFGEDFETPGGPDLHVYLTTNTEPTERRDIQNGLRLGKLKSTVGKQVYEFPADTPFDVYNSVTIHCKAFNVPWSYAPFE